MRKLSGKPIEHGGNANGASRVVRAPASVGPLGAPAVLSVELDDDEEFCGHSKFYMDGRSLVTGYSFVRRGKVFGRMASGRPRLLVNNQ